MNGRCVTEAKNTNTVQRASVTDIDTSRGDANVQKKCFAFEWRTREAGLQVHKVKLQRT